MPAPDTSLPIVVDLDGSLISNDLLHETASRFVSQQPRRCAELLGWVRLGKARLKKELWDAAPVRVEHLAYHPELLTWLRQEKARGRTLVLASACAEGAAQAVADHLGIFDLVLASDATTNLSSEAKADALVARFGEQGFEYVGNHRHDLAVWRRAAVAHVVGGDRALLAKATSTTRAGHSFDRPHDRARAWVRALRPHQWTKNSLIFVPLLSAHRISELDSVVAAVLAFVSFNLAASSVYLLNDIADVENDRDHPTKRTRPFAAGTASLLAGWVAWPLLALAALGLGLAVSPLLSAVLVVYLVVTTAYSLALKRKPLIDVLTLAVLYTIRIVAGAAAVQVTLSTWLLSFSCFFFLSLALVKRVSELYRTRLTNSTAVGRGYRADDLELLSSYGVTTSVASVLVFTLFISDEATAKLYDTPGLLWFSVPLILAWLMRIWLLAHRGEMNEDPILYAIRDRVSICAGIAVVLIFLAATTLTV